MSVKNWLKCFGVGMVLSLLVVSCFSNYATAAEQTGVLMEEPVNVREETFLKYQEAFGNFTYVEDVGDTWRLLDGTQPFAGDCEDFAFALQAMVGAGSVYSVYRYKTSAVDHAVFVHAGVVWDNGGVGVVLRKYEALYGHVMFRLGDYSPETR
jgi:hypothetical protein